MDNVLGFGVAFVEDFIKSSILYKKNMGKCKISTTNKEQCNEDGRGNASHFKTCKQIMLNTKDRTKRQSCM